MKASRVRNGANTNVALIFASITALLVFTALVVAFTREPPALGWVGFGLASAVVVAIGAAATLIVPRMRVSPARPATALHRRRQVLVVADPDCSAIALCDAIEAHVDGGTTVHLVLPVRVSRLHFLTKDESEERRDAEQTLSLALALLRQRGVATTGSVGTDKPLESMTDALAGVPATEVLLVAPSEEEAYWLETRLAGERARAHRARRQPSRRFVHHAGRGMRAR